MGGSRSLCPKSVREQSVRHLALHVASPIRRRLTSLVRPFMANYIAIMINLVLIALFHRFLIYRLDHVSQAKLFPARFLVTASRSASLIEGWQLSGRIMRDGVAHDHRRTFFQAASRMMRRIPIPEPGIGVEKGKLRVQRRQDRRPRTTGLARLTSTSVRAHTGGRRGDRRR